MIIKISEVYIAKLEHLAALGIGMKKYRPYVIISYTPMRILVLPLSDPKEYKKKPPYSETVIVKYYRNVGLDSENWTVPNNEVPMHPDEFKNYIHPHYTKTVGFLDKENLELARKSIWNFVMNNQGMQNEHKIHKETAKALKKIQDDKKL